MDSVWRFPVVISCAVVLMIAAPDVGAGFIVASPIGATVLAGKPFDIIFTANTAGATMVSYEFALAVSAGGSGVFEVTGRRTLGSPFSDVLPEPHTWPDALDLQTDQVFGGHVPEPGDPAVPGTDLFLSAFTLRTPVSASAGTYTISVVNWRLVYADAPTDSGALGPGTSITVIPVPEPGSVALLLLALPSALLLRRRRS